MLADTLRSRDCLEDSVGGLGGVVWAGYRGRVSRGPFNNLLKSSERFGLTPAARWRGIADRAKRWRRAGGECTGQFSWNAFLGSPRSPVIPEKIRTHATT
ncbi:unnamed protein product [Pleuronectes platessa]|uniref:Uncharacterized protein n=1 Tax=Pleuronectes platessa TaxID=8262 RepID=A0A9N7V1W7_PLEPL|nr:unnamed protein product [Pleuronectes platessa]